MELLVVGLAAVATAVLSALAGLGGGMILLGVLAQFFAPATAIPIHGGIQFVSNGSRAAMLREDVSWSAVLRSCVLMLPMSLLGVAVAVSLPDDAMRLVLGVFLLLTVWRPGLLRWRGGNPMTERSLIVVGGVSGFLNTTVGASGPFTSPFFKAVTVSHTAFVATAAASQVLAHSAKLASYVFVDGFDVTDHGSTVAVGAVGVTLGSWVGTRLLRRVKDVALDTLFRVVLTILALRLILRAVM